MIVGSDNDRQISAERYGIQGKQLPELAFGMFILGYVSLSIMIDVSSPALYTVPEDSL